MLHPDHAASTPLQGRRVLITRSADRARPLASLLRSKGAIPYVLPLIDFERAVDQATLDAALDRLASGGFDWLVISSTTTVRVLLEKAAERGLEPTQLVAPGTRVATIGPSSQQALEAVGFAVSLAPVGVQSADGLIALWKPAGERVLLPQADIAAPGLQEGLAAKGAEVEAVTAYHTVDYPADKQRRLTAMLPPAVELSQDGPLEEMSVAAARSALDAGSLDAVVAASPSAARRIDQALVPLGKCRLIAIGRPTAAEALRLGLDVSATAQQPTPDGIATALETVFANEGKPQ